MNATWLGSPNFTQGRGGATIDRIVMHWMDGTMANADTRFADSSQQVSAHYGIEDTNVHQYVQEQDTAWHAGVFAMNQRSIGIEHSADPSRPASAATVETSSQLVAGLCKRYGIPCDRQHIIKHNEVPYATECCGTLPIDQIVQRANQLLQGGDDMVPTRDLLNSLFRNYLGRPASDAEAAQYVGKIDYNTLIPILEDNNAEHDAYMAQKGDPAAATKLAQIKAIVGSK